MEIIRNGADLSAYLRDINDIYESNGWGRGYSDEKIRKMFSASIYRLAVADGAAVGLLRAYVVLMGKTAVKIKNACQKIGFDNTIIGMSLMMAPSKKK